MRVLIFSVIMILSFSVAAQIERDTTLSRCPVFIVDTVSGNNFFNEARSAILKVYRVKGNLTIAIVQKDQAFTLFFRDKRLKSTKYKIQSYADGKNEIIAKYTFSIGDQVSFISVSSGIVEVLFDKEKELWRLKMTGLIANYSGSSVSNYKVRANFAIK